MAYALDSSTPVSTGIKTWTIGFQASRIRFVASPGTSSTSVVRESEGLCDGTTQICDSKTIDSQRFQQRYNDRLCSISEWNGVSWVEIFRVNFDSITATEVKYNVVTNTNPKQIRREAWS